jgi:hypothetical protein
MAAPLLLSDTEQILNWDFTCQSPAPPYDPVEIALSPTLDAQDAFIFTHLSRTRRTGRAASPNHHCAEQCPVPALVNISIAAKIPGDLAEEQVLDGLFSIGVSWDDNFLPSSSPLLTHSAFGQVDDTRTTDT